ncbi:ABC transporter [Arachidicoccus ginsenosidimutans]|uniref:ABC transporter ATP-binding protein n=1 Tax=Arachidicoccus sp. BS20 TaxID=1850526 RepID=UPI0007F14AB8|nr:ABC transporter ATP-binding protein [Arachidicoccus sp. BS20]ANI90487.1 ABC transporter [Arachidicoccus sp. BS20]
MESIISIKNLEKSYGTKQVLNNINLDVYAGQVLGYIGPNGAGKSTTVKILCGLINDFSGSVTIKGVDLKEEPIKAKSLIGYVPESAELYDVLTPREFLSFIGNLYEMDEAVCQNRIVRIMSAFGLENNLDQRMESFSKGMKQKVLIASGILHNPDIIILDEPLSGLDANSVIIIKDLINRLAKEGKTIFYCSHMMDIVEKVSDRIILINNGSIIADGSIEELKQQNGNQSLEQIFSNLTNVNVGEASNDLMNAFN